MPPAGALRWRKAAIPVGSANARKELQWQGEVPATWAELTHMLGKLPESCVVVEGESVRVWSDATPAGKAELPGVASLTKRETEVWRWINCSGPSASGWAWKTTGNC